MPKISVLRSIKSALVTGALPLTGPHEALREGVHGAMSPL